MILGVHVRDTCDSRGVQIGISIIAAHSSENRLESADTHGLRPMVFDQVTGKNIYCLRSRLPDKVIMILPVHCPD